MEENSLREQWQCQISNDKCQMKTMPLLPRSTDFTCEMSKDAGSVYGYAGGGRAFIAGSD